MISNNVMIQDHNSHPIKKLDRRKQLVNLQKKPTNVYDLWLKKLILEMMFGLEQKLQS